MALSKEQKQAVVDDLVNLLEDSKITVLTKYAGVSVKEMQDLRRKAAESGTTLRVAKNRLVKIAVKSVDPIKDADTSALEGQLLYAFNAEDEVAPAQVIKGFMKEQPALEFVGAINDQGEFLDAETVKQLADLPSKDQLRGQVVGTIAAPLSGFVNVLGGNVRSILNVLNARKEQLEG